VTTLNPEPANVLERVIAYKRAARRLWLGKSGVIQPTPFRFTCITVSTPYASCFRKTYYVSAVGGGATGIARWLLDMPAADAQVATLPKIRIGFPSHTKFTIVSANGTRLLTARLA